MKKNEHTDMDRYDEMRASLNALKDLYGEDVLQEMIKLERDAVFCLEIDDMGKLIVCVNDTRIELSLTPIQRAIYLLLIRYKGRISKEELHSDECYKELLYLYLAFKGKCYPFGKHINSNGCNNLKKTKEYIRAENTVQRITGEHEYYALKYCLKHEKAAKNCVYNSTNTINQYVNQINKTVKILLEDYPYLIDVFCIGKRYKNEPFILKIGTLREQLVWNRSELFPTNIFESKEDRDLLYLEKCLY